MKHIAIGVALLGLVAARPVMAADEKQETKVEKKSDDSGSKTTVERSSKDGSAKVDEKSKVDTHVRSDGAVETKKDVKKSQKMASGKKHKVHAKEKTVRDSQGNVVEHEKTVK